MYQHHTTCRACGLGKLALPTLKQSTAAGSVYAPEQAMTTVLDLGLQPLANDFRKAEEERAGYAPLKVLFCPRCTLAQLSVVVNPNILYGNNYPYVTSKSNTMRQHFDALARVLPWHSLWEIGSNDGTFLEYWKQKTRGRVLGIEPAANLCKMSSAKQIPTLHRFFGTECARELHDGFYPGQPLPEIILARHCFCHVHDWRDFIDGLGIVSNPDTLIAIEVPYVVDQMELGSWDQIYFEHLSYLSVGAMEALLKGSKLHLHDVKHFPIHGGVILLMLRHNDWPEPPNATVQSFIKSENLTVDSWKAFAVRAQSQIHELGSYVRGLAAAGQRVCGYGASAKSSVWMNACGFTRKEIAFVTDDTPAKQYTFCPGTEIPVYDPGALLRELPEYCILFAWNYAAEILAKESLARQKGVKFIIPVPKLEIV